MEVPDQRRVSQQAFYQFSLFQPDRAWFRFRTPVIGWVAAGPEVHPNLSVLVLLKLQGFRLIDQPIFDPIDSLQIQLPRNNSDAMIQ